MLNDYIKINRLKNVKMAKCECCDTVKDIYVRLSLYDVNDPDIETLFGNIDFCKNCLKNFVEILEIDFDLSKEIVLKEFKL